MRTHGTLIKWNDERGFGFIAPAQGGDELFVHISAFNRRGVRPALNELVSFEIHTKSDGTRQAVRVMRAGEGSRAASARRRDSNAPARSGIGIAALAIAAMVAVGGYVYSRSSPPRLDGTGFARPAASASSAAQARPSVAAPAPDSASSSGSASVRSSTQSSQGFVCDGRQHCSQMSSCAEAEYFLRHCPDTRMDGDSDGEPCEQQCPR
ncbi:Cold shock protein [Lysobacter antibioticus]|uniref:cold shock domain-containing protein n=1 Tax=Lysobacter antibioticus TaxID=84531 RepID=UPI0007173DA9|nr:cold shock domain-containing protein [Lysobacter antibioticus]ALN61039.1 Cold shock protein [Lysobacter antibioticus]